MKKNLSNKQRKKETQFSRISFTLIDPIDAVVPGIKVILTNQKTGQGYSEITDDHAIAKFNLLPRGKYKLETEDNIGFKPIKNRYFQIQQPIEPNVNLSLEIGSITGVIVYSTYEIPLFEAISQEDNEIIKQQILSGFEINTKDESGRTALHVAVEHGNLEILKFLLEKGADINAKTKDGVTPIWMIEEDDEIALEIFRLLISKKADVNVPNENKETLLMRAAEYDELEVVKLLLKAGANPNLTDQEGKTAFMKTDSDEIKLLLLRYGARK